MTILRAFKRENIPAYFAVMGGTTLAGLASCAVGYGATPEGVRSAALPGLLVGGLLGAFGGMTILFVASLLNLRKLRPGFERLAGPAHRRSRCGVENKYVAVIMKRST